MRTSVRRNRSSAPRPLDVLASRPAVRLLRHLLTHPGAYTGRQLAAEAGVHPEVAAEALSRLVDMAVLERRHAGRAYLYTLKEKSYLVSDVIGPAFRNEAQWLDRLGQETFEGLSPLAESVILYGSWARGDAISRSDVDLLVIAHTDDDAKESERRLLELRGQLTERFGQSVSVLLVPEDDVRQRLRSGDRLLSTIAREGRTLAGRSLGEIAASGG